MTLVFGLTGGIATGKSTVAAYLSEAGIPIVDADVASKEVVKKGTKGLASIAEIFGDDVLLADGNLDREKLGDIIFSNDDARMKLNDLLHPRIFEWVEAERDRLIEQGAPIIMLDIPLLYETNYESEVDQVILVYTTPDIQVNRLMARNHLTKEAAMERIDSQLPIEDKKGQADIVIDNSFSREETYAQLDDWLNKMGISLA